MPTVDELLEQDENIGVETDGFTKDERYKTIEYSDYQIVQISNKTIGNYSQQISSQGEINSQYIVFEHERYMDGIDLADKLIQIHYELPDGFQDNSEVVNVQYSDSIIQFGWLITDRITMNSGTVMFMPFFYGNTTDGEPYLLKDLFARYSIRENLGVDDGIIEPVEENWYIQFLDNINALQNYTDTASISAASASQSAQEAATSAQEAQSAQESVESNVQVASQSAQAAQDSQASASISAASASQSAQEAATSAQEAQKLMISSMGDLTFFVNMDKKCLSVTYAE